MTANTQEELLRVKARESKYKKAAEARIAELETELKALRGTAPITPEQVKQWQRTAEAVKLFDIFHRRLLDALESSSIQVKILQEGKRNLAGKQEESLSSIMAAITGDSQGGSQDDKAFQAAVASMTTACEMQQNLLLELDRDLAQATAASGAPRLFSCMLAITGRAHALAKEITALAGKPVQIGGLFSEIPQYASRLDELLQINSRILDLRYILLPEGEDL